MKIVLVYIGKEAPRYVYENLKYLQEVVGINPILITDNPKTFSYCSSNGIQAWLAPQAQDLLGDVYANMQHPREFRKGFWFNTVARFGAIAAFMNAHPNEKVLQIEADVWITPKFPFEKFHSIKSQIAFGLETSTTGSAALLYLSDNKVAEELLRIVRLEYQKNPYATDMTILGNIYLNKLLDTLILPSIPKMYESQNLYSDVKTVFAISEFTDFFGGVFDPITLGLYLTGEDPKNHRGFVRKFQSYSWHNFGFGPDSLEIDNNGHVYFGSESKVPVFSIHNHAKEIKLFQANKYSSYLVNQVNASKNGPRTEFRLRIFLYQLKASIFRRLKLNAE